MYRVLIVVVALILCVNANSQEFSSGGKQVPLIELYTSEGCSSCPPADRWLSGLKSHEELWSGFVPLAFHVDYWDYIGWKDPFASPEYSQRQRRYAHQYNESTVYTPGVRKAGEEWRAWRLWAGPTQSKAKAVGNLKFNVSTNGEFNASFNGIDSTYDDKALQLNVAVLGLNLATEVKRGENRGKTLEHDFVVLQISRFSSADASAWSGNIEKPALASIDYAIAAWLSEKGSVNPVQACGGYLDSGIWQASL